MGVPSTPARENVMTEASAATSMGSALAGKRAVVTGAGRGVGRAIALELARRGIEVIVNDLADERVRSVVAEIHTLGGVAMPAPVDVTDWEAVRGAAEHIGRVDIVVNNAGNAGRRTMLTSADLVPFAQTSPADWDSYVRVNLYGVMHVTRAFLPAMMEGTWGRIVTVISDAGRVGEPAMAAYSAAKAGAAGFSRSVAREVARYGITVNCVSLGTIGAESGSEAEIGDESRARAMSRYLIRRTGRPSEAAALVVFLCGPDADWITGQTYPVNGGYSLTL